MRNYVSFICPLAFNARVFRYKSTPSAFYSWLVADRNPMFSLSVIGVQ
jgi:hypothetical protein